MTDLDGPAEALRHDRPLRPPPGRYGPEPRPRLRAAGLGLLGLLGVALALWLGADLAATPVSWRDVAFDVVDEGRVDLTFDVSRTDAASDVHCRVHALNATHAEVGVVVVEVPGDERRTVRTTTPIGTSERAVTAVVDQCWPAGDEGQGGPAAG